MTTSVVGYALALGAWMQLDQVTPMPPKQEEFSICEALDRRHDLVTRSKVRVTGIDRGDGVIRSDCADWVEVNGYRRPAAMKLRDARFIRDSPRPFGAMSFDEYIAMRLKEGKPGSDGRLRYPERRVVLIGQLEIRPQDGRPGEKRPDRGPFAGFGQFGLYILSMEVRWVIPTMTK